MNETSKETLLEYLKRAQKVQVDNFGENFTIWINCYSLNFIHVEIVVWKFSQNGKRRTMKKFDLEDFASPKENEKSIKSFEKYIAKAGGKI